MSALPWILAEELPDDDTTVLTYSPDCGEPVWLGYFDSTTGDWREISGDVLPGVTHWAHVPEGPAVEAQRRAA